jgi:hypothetical protein
LASRKRWKLGVQISRGAEDGTSNVFWLNLIDANHQGEQLAS